MLIMVKMMMKMKMEMKMEMEMTMKYDDEDVKAARTMVFHVCS